jgi:UDP-2,3-diacylglucosamine pyrophosphatase LpxH
MSSSDTLIVSDVHLGSEVSRAGSLLETLRSTAFKRLILLGDIFDDLNFRRLRKSHWELLSHIRDLTSENSQIEVVWVEGNHDEGLAEITSHFIGVGVYKEYVWQEGGATYLAVHGHQFDRFLTEHAVITDIACGIYKFLQTIDLERQRVSRFAKRTTKTWLRQSELVATRAIAYAKSKGADFVFCGHTHLPISTSAQGVTYCNSGCWTDIPSTYIRITDGEPHIHERW